MEKFTKVDGIAAPLPMMNVDTDQIIPKQFLKTVERTGLAKGLFYDFRWAQDGTKTDFILDQEPYNKAKILVAGDNFGCGSSREHAPWALMDFGIKVVISTSFADIFFNNCFKNGILPIVLPKAQRDALMEDAQMGGNAVISVDLEKQVITRPNGETIPFDVEPFRRHCLLNGLDDIGLTLEKASEIDAYEARRRSQTPWLYQDPAA
ncbi:3-isopropylmalate dehydratase small subunit [Marinibaculum pumilum]|uniref:3-isopropylmalate dehydratase small subunit n=1 Tax=Marinibaculum pumilum TaxID=1766165 RepID=A0ABV7L0P7_9PROT